MRWEVVVRGRVQANERCRLIWLNGGQLSLEYSLDWNSEEGTASGEIVQAFPVHSIEAANRFYTRVFQVKMPAWAFEGKTGARRILAEDPETKELLAFIKAAARAVVTGEGRVSLSNVRHFLSLDYESSCVLFGCDVRWSFDGGKTWIHTRAKWYDDDRVSVAELVEAQMAAASHMDEL